MTEGVVEPTYKKRVAYHGTLLGGFATLAATLLVMGNIATHDTIEQRLAEDLQASLSQVLPASLHDNNLLDNRLNIQHDNKQVIVYQAIKNDEASAIAFSVIGQGYAGEIKLILGINAAGEVLGVRVLSHAETPGLGDKIEVEKDDWMFSFNGLSYKKLAEDKWKVKKDGGEFDQFSGATITPRAVVSAVKQGLDLFNQHRDELLNIKDTGIKLTEKTPEQKKTDEAVDDPEEDKTQNSAKEIKTNTNKVENTEGETHE